MINLDSRLGFEPNTPEQLAAAAQTCRRFATDSAEADMFLAMVGLSGEQP